MTVTKRSIEERVDWALALGGAYDPNVYKTLAVFTRSTKYFSHGDVVVAVVDDGQAERCKVYGMSSKVGKVNGLYQQFQRWRHGEGFRNRVAIQLIDLLGVGTSSGTLQDPAIRSFAISAVRGIVPSDG